MRFVKVQDPSKKNTQWILLISNTEDMLKYLLKDKQGYYQAMLSMAEQGKISISHIGSKREDILKTVMELYANCLPQGEQIFPADVITNIIFKKAEGMLKYLNAGLTVRVNEGGGFCDWEDWQPRWKFEVIGEVNKADCNFPNDNQPIKAQILFLENDNYVTSKLLYHINKSCPGNHGYIYNLKEQDEQWVLQSIVNCPTIAISTKAVDLVQANDMIKLFSAIPKKKVIIDTPDSSRLTGLPGWHEVAAKHDVIFL